MTRDELKTWLLVTDKQVDSLIARGMPAAAGSQFDPDAVASGLSANGLTESTADDKPPPGYVRTVRELAGALGKSRPTVAGWLSEGGAPGPDERGFYNIAAVRKWRNDRDRELRRPQSYRGAATVSDADVDELRDIIRNELLSQNGLVLGALEAAINAMAGLVKLPKDPALRRHEIIVAVHEGTKQFLVQKDELEPEVERRTAEVLELLPQ